MTKEAQQNAIDHARSLLSEHFENVLVVVGQDKDPSPFVVASGSPAALLGFSVIGREFVLTHSKRGGNG